MRRQSREGEWKNGAIVAPPRQVERGPSAEVSEDALVKGDARSGERFLPLESHPSRGRFRRADNLRSRGHMSRKLPLPLPGTARALASFSTPPDPWIAPPTRPRPFQSHLVLAELLSDAVKIFLHQQRTKCPFLDMLTEQNYSYNLRGRTSQEKKYIKVGRILKSDLEDPFPRHPKGWMREPLSEHHRCRIWFSWIFRGLVIGFLNLFLNLYLCEPEETTAPQLLCLRTFAH